MGQWGRGNRIKAMRILIVEDDESLVRSLNKGLTEEGFVITTEKNGFKARDRILSERWDLFIFDMMLPGLTGTQLCELVRFKKIKTPVLMLSALSEAEDKIKALDIGADDYMTKPFHFKELVSRINALSRRSKTYSSNFVSELFCGALKLNYAQNKVVRNGREISLSTKELRLLKLLLENKDTVVDRSKILREVWNTKESTYTNVIDVYISYLRRKIDDNYSQKLIHTVKGRGYMITDE